MTAADELERLWEELAPDGGPPPIVLEGATVPMPTRYRVADAAAVSIGVALAAAVRWRGARQARLDVREAVAAFAAERSLRVDGRPVPLWDPLAGDHRALDGWVRLHTNYPHHRRAVLRVLGLAGRNVDRDLDQHAGRHVDRAAVGAAVRQLRATRVEEAVAAAGGAAAALRTPAQWRAHPQHAVLSSRPLVAITDHPDGASGAGGVRDADRPLRVLDLTRVIAGPTATKVLAAAGADVLRLDPPGFEEVAAILPDTTAGKRCARLDLRTGPGRDRFAELVRQADVLVCGLRPGALDRLGWPAGELSVLNPRLVVALLSAYGDAGPWAGRRGFDSLVQTATGIAHPDGDAEGGTRSGEEVPAAPVPLPVQALDHASGWLLAAGALRALHRRRGDGRGRTVEVVLARTAGWLDDLGRTPGDPLPGAGPDAASAPAPAALADAEVETVDSSLGRVTRVRAPGTLDGVPLAWAGPPSELGAHPARFVTARPGGGTGP